MSDQKALSQTQVLINVNFEKEIETAWFAPLCKLHYNCICFLLCVITRHGMLSSHISAAVFLYNVVYLRNNKTLRALNQLDGSTEKAVKL